MDHDSKSSEIWRQSRQVKDLDAHREAVLAIIREIEALTADAVAESGRLRQACRVDSSHGSGPAPLLTDRSLRAVLKRHPREGSRLYSKNLLIRVYMRMCDQGILTFDEALVRSIRMKPIRTLSGVAPVTVLTRPGPCPGECIFCPSEEGMPKSYLSGEPGAQRAKQHGFDPHAQTHARIEALRTNGHAVDKIELLILGGSWTAYPEEYQDWFLRRCLEAMNGATAGSLEEAQRINETAPHRNVGLVVETRPDEIDAPRVRRLRLQGVTKVQLGAQSFDDAVLTRNLRGHTVQDTRRAVGLLRRAGFKVILHWMPNLLGSDPGSDRADFARMWSDPGLRPDEIKIYPCSLLEGTGLYRQWEEGLYKPYPDSELIGLVADCKATVPGYCRINRVYRDIPSTCVIEGCRISNLRELVQKRLCLSGRRCRCLRCREIRNVSVDAGSLKLRQQRLATTAGDERFLCFEDESGQAAGYLRLLLPADAGSDETPGLPELRGAALVREVHVYGPALSIGAEGSGQAQHQGLGTALLEEAERLARDAGYARMAVISAVGTRGYYRGRGYALEGTYMVKRLCDGRQPDPAR